MLTPYSFSILVLFQGPGVTSISLASLPYHDNNITSSAIFRLKSLLAFKTVSATDMEDVKAMIFSNGLGYT